MPLEAAVTFSNGITGANSKKGRDGTSSVIEFDHAVYSPIDTQMGTVSGARVHGAVELVKPIDTASPSLYQHACTGQQLDEVKFDWYRINPATGQEEVYFTHTLKNAKVASVKQYLPNTKDPALEAQVHLEKVKLLYEKMTWTHADGYEYEDSWKAF